MKKCLPYANYLAAGAGVAAALLRFWMLGAGLDEKGLYPAAHPGWIGYLLVIVAALIGIFLMTRQCQGCGTWSPNFPTGIFSMAGHVAAAGGIFFYSLPQLQAADRLILAGGVLGMVAAATLLALTIPQLRQKPQCGAAYLLPCLFCAMQLFLMAKTYSTETQSLLFLPQVFAFAASTLACYQMAGFGVALGNRRRSLFWSLSAGVLCLAAAPGNHWGFAALGLWHLLSHCVLEDPTQVTEEPTETDQ